MISAPVLDKLERYLDVVSLRHQLVSGNIANVDTPGYRTRDIDFDSALQSAIERDTAPTVHEVPGLVRRPDGNDVSIDREGLLLSETQLQYRLGVQLVRSEFRRLLTAINEGRP